MKALKKLLKGDVTILDTILSPATVVYYPVTDNYRIGKQYLKKEELIPFFARWIVTGIVTKAAEKKIEKYTPLVEIFLKSSISILLTWLKKNHVDLENFKID